MKVGLVVPCYVDMLYPEVGIAALELLERPGVVHYPFEQTCCGQPMANSGCEEDSQAANDSRHARKRNGDQARGTP
jgi:L-lactate dehydrogenase complex protein LldE